MNNINLGDKIRHKNNQEYNALLMEVLEVEEDKVLCQYFDSKEKATKEKWFDKEELELAQKAEGGFFE